MFQRAADTEVTASRVAGEIILSASSLTLLEKLSFNDLLQEWCIARPSSVGKSQVISAALQQSFFERVFNLWDSDDEHVSFPVLVPKKLSQTSTPIGTFKDNLPVTPTKRKREQTAQGNDRRKAL
ncbi:hypothetical protein IL306_010917 [Fusarium sp. DS 682]|nr:hypothetical protein IL306_010917 [Fusarium sp. DS 682]